MAPRSRNIEEKTMNTEYSYYINTQTKTDATVNGSLHSDVLVRIDRMIEHGYWATLEERKFSSLTQADKWAKWRIAQ